MVQHDLITRTKRIVVTVILSLAWIRPAHAENAQELASVRSQYDAAASLFTQKDYEGARKLLLEIWGQRKTADVATLLGQIEVKLGHHADAAKYLAFASANFPPTEPVKHGEVIRGWLVDEKKRVITCEVTSNPDGAAVSVDGVEIGTTPLATPVFMDPGLHIVVLKKDGYKLADRSINASAGASEVWNAKLVPLEAATPATESKPEGKDKVAVVPISPPPDTTPASSKPNPWILVGGGVVALGALATGLVFDLKAHSKYDKARDLRAQLDSGSCSTSSGNVDTSCSSLLDHAKQGDRYRNIETVSFVVAGAVALGTVTYWLWPRAKPTERAGRITLGGTVSKQQSALSLTANF